jgi:hypothetical protein
MKKLKTTRQIYKDIEEIESLMNKIGGVINSVSKSCNDINTEYAKNIKTLLKKIAEGENLDYEMLKEKYLKSSSKEISDVNNTNIIDDQTTIDESSEIIFDKIIIDNTNYYYENKENGKIYDSSSNIVGIYKNKKFILN